MKQTKHNNDLFIIIPAHNESERIEKVLKEVKKYCENIIVVDDGSTDDTFEIAKQEGVIVLKHIVNLGKGAALKTGCDFAIHKDAKKIIVMDADGQHEPKLIPNFLKALETFNLVFGFRELSNNMPLLFRIGNFGINTLTEILFNIQLKDTQSGFRAFNAKTYKQIRWKANDYSMESEMIARAGNKKIKYCEIPITTIYSDRYKGTTMIDGLKVGINLIKWRLFSL